MYEYMNQRGHQAPSGRQEARLGRVTGSALFVLAWKSLVSYSDTDKSHTSKREREYLLLPFSESPTSFMVVLYG